MMTWEIMIGAQLISILASAGVVISFMLKKEPLDVPGPQRHPRRRWS